MRFRVGDLVVLSDPWIDDETPWLIIGASKSKKTWHKNFVLYRNGDIRIYPYSKMKECFSRVISQVPMVSA